MWLQVAEAVNGTILVRKLPAMSIKMLGQRLGMPGTIWKSLKMRKVTSEETRDLGIEVGDFISFGPSYHQLPESKLYQVSLSG